MNANWKILFLGLIGLGASTISMAQDQDTLPRVVVLATGGTIASLEDPETGALIAALTGEEIIQAVPGLREVANVTVEQIANVGSRNMTPDIWRVLAGRANELLASFISGAPNTNPPG